MFITVTFGIVSVSVIVCNMQLTANTTVVVFVRCRHRHHVSFPEYAASRTDDDSKSNNTTMLIVILLVILAVIIIVIVIIAVVACQFRNRKKEDGILRNTFDTSFFGPTKRVLPPGAVDGEELIE